MLYLYCFHYHRCPHFPPRCPPAPNPHPPSLWPAPHCCLCLRVVLLLVRTRRKGNPGAPLMGVQTGAATVGNSTEFPQKVKNELPCPSNPTSGNVSKNPETPIRKNMCTPMCIAALFTIARIWKQPKCPSMLGCKKAVVHLYSGILGSHEKRLAKERMFHCSYYN